MNQHITFSLGLAGLLLAGVFTGTALASSNDAGDEAAALESAKITLVQAIATAEQQTGGRAYDAGVDRSHTPVRMVVETTGPQGVQTVAVDGQSGLIVATHSGGEED